MKFEIFMNFVYKAMKENPEWRYGQAIFNVLHFMDHNEADKIRTTELDCFYNDKIAEATLNYLEKLWEGHD